MQDFLQLNDMPGQCDPLLRIMGGHCETSEGHTIHMLQNKG